MPEARAPEEVVSAVRQRLYRRDRAGALALVDDGAELNVFDLAALGDDQGLRDRLAADRGVAHAWSADGFTALHLAAFLGGAAAVGVLLEAGADVGAVARNELLVQPLHSAAANRDVESCRLLLDAGADPNAAQQGGHRPLDAALFDGNEPLAALLRERGAEASDRTAPPEPA